MLSRICHHTKVLRRCWPVIASNGRFLSVTGGNYSLPEPKWSVKALNLLDDNGDGVVQIDTVERLADLACIDLKYISSNGDHMATKEMICKDVNVILKCAQSLKDCPLNDELIEPNQAAHLSSLREDVVVHTTPLLKRTKDLFLNVDSEHVLVKDNGDKYYKVSTSFKSLQQV